MDHDQFFKTVIREYVAEFMWLFFPQDAKRYQFDQLEWLQQEEYTDILTGNRLVMDLVAKVQFTEPQTLNRFLDPFNKGMIFFEVDSEDSMGAYPLWMFHYFCVLRMRHQLPVLGIAIFPYLGKEGIGSEDYTETLPHDKGQTELVRYPMRYVGLKAFDAKEYLAQDNLLGVAFIGLMKLPKKERVEMIVAAQVKIIESSENDARKKILVECIRSYNPLSKQEKEEVDRIMQENHPEVKEVISPWMLEVIEEAKPRIIDEARPKIIDEARPKIIDEARPKIIDDTKRLMLQRLLERKFGSLTSEHLSKLRDADGKILEQIEAGLLSARSLAELGLE